MRGDGRRTVDVGTCTNETNTSRPVPKLFFSKPRSHEEPFEKDRIPAAVCVTSGPSPSCGIDAACDIGTHDLIVLREFWNVSICSLSNHA